MYCGDETAAIVGDIGSSRVARSNLHALTMCGADVVLVGPSELVSTDFERLIPTEAERGRVTPQDPPAPSNASKTALRTFLYSS